jgi:hypothetical protein
MRTFKTFLTAGLLLLLHPSWGQNVVTDTTATVVAYWQKGDKTQLSLTMTKEKYEDGLLKLKSSSTSIVDIFIADATEKSYTIHWKYSSVKINEAKENPFAIKLAKLSEGLTVIYKTNEMGTFDQLVNWKEIQNFIFASIDKIGKEFNTMESKKELDLIKNIYTTKESIEQAVLKDIQLYHNIYGGEYKLKEKLVAASVVPNFLGGDPLPSTLTVEMTDLKPKANYCKIQVHQDIDTAKITKVLNDWFKKVSDGKSGETRIPTVGVSDFFIFEVELISGWISRAYSKRTVIADNIKNIDIYELKRL